MKKIIHSEQHVPFKVDDKFIDNKGTRFTGAQTLQLTKDIKSEEMTATVKFSDLDIKTLTGVKKL